MPTLADTLELDRCPQCGIAHPYLQAVFSTDTVPTLPGRPRKWKVYVCRSCGGLVTAARFPEYSEIIEYHPSKPELSELIPPRPRHILQEAINALSTPSGAIVLAASAVDAMLQELGFTKGKLYPRINEAKENGSLTATMADWAHAVRLEANAERHPGYDSAFATTDEARQVIEFASALAEFLFVLPSKAARVIEANTKKEVKKINNDSPKEIT